MKGMTIIVKKATQILCGIIFLYGIYIVFHGHLTPGGGFAGGAIISGAFILLVIAFGSESSYMKKLELSTSIFESGAILTFIIVAAIGLFIANFKVFFKNFLPKGVVGNLISAGVIPIYNIVVGIEVAAALFTIFLALIIYRDEVSR